jgi:acid stress-induced BolA-like protein IbaG/YrbA
MLTCEEIKQAIAHHSQVTHVEVTGDGYHYQATVVNPEFEGLSRVVRQQWVYERINHWIQSGQLHAVSLTTLTPAEWEKHNG